MAYDPMQELEKLGQPQPQGQPAGAAFGAMGDPGQASGPASFGAMGDPGKPAPAPQGGPASFGAMGDQKPQPQAQAGPAQFGAMGAPQAASQPAAPGAKPVSAAGPQGVPAAPGMDPNAALGQVGQAFSQKFGRAMTPEEQSALTKYVGYTGGAVDDAMLQKALGAVGQYSGNIANPFGAAPSGGASGGDPGVGTNNLVQDELQKLLKTGSTEGMTLDPNNPAIQAQRSAFERRNSQQTGREKLAMAESAAARNGLGSGGFSADIAAAENARAGRSADFEGQLLGQELQSQRDRVMKGIEMANSSGNAAMARQLQEKLGLIDADIRRTGQKGQLGLGMLQTLLGDQRAKDALGFNYAQLGVNANQNLLNSILSGL